jgi:hypothetical protein
MKYLQTFAVLWLLIVVTGCGDASAIKSYSYATRQVNLDKAVQKVLRANPNITIDTTPTPIIVRRNPGDINDTTTKVIRLSEFRGRREDSLSMAEDEKAEFKIWIKAGGIENYYRFRYLGTSSYWNSSSTSAIFISYARDKQGHSLSQGENEHGEFRSQLAKDLTLVFETEVVNRIDKELNLEHTND